MAQPNVRLARTSATLVRTFPLTEKLVFVQRQAMISILRRAVADRQTCNFFTDSCRYAGHSKWANIKHTKEEKDFERNILFNSLRNKMRVAISEGGSPEPSKNLQLAQVIEVARKSNMPIATIQNVLLKAQKATKDTKITTYEVRAPGGCILLIHCNTSNPTQQKMQMASVLKKFSASYADSQVKHLFEHKGIIIADHQSDVEKATEDAILADAEEVEEFENKGEKYLKFICEPSSLPKVKNKLESMKYCIISSKEEYTPKMLVEISEDNMEVVSRLCDRLLSMENVERIDDNIA